ncbi:Pre-mRNA-splicing factor 38, partial [Hyaloraphidium curvatum]
MANRTVDDAKQGASDPPQHLSRTSFLVPLPPLPVHGTNPQYLIEKIIRSRIYDSPYWKEHCFALTAETIIDKAVQLNAIGGVFGGNQRPTDFICLVLKMLQLQPDEEIVVEYIRQKDFKYLRALGAYYLRLVGRSEDIYKELEALFVDYRKLRRRTSAGGFEITPLDAFIDELLREERALDVQLPRLRKRSELEYEGRLDPRHSAL